MTEEQKFIAESISYLIKSGFWDSEDVEEFITEEINENDLEGKINEKWIKETILKEERALLKASKNWHVPTTTQKLVKAFDQLVNQHIIALHYAGYTIDDGYYEVDQIEEQLQAKGKKSKGICFYNEQDLQRAFREKDPYLTLAFQDMHSEKEEDSISVGKKIVQTLQENGFKTEWDGTATQKITILNFAWQQAYKPENALLLDYDSVAEKLLKTI